MWECSICSYDKNSGECCKICLTKQDIDVLPSSTTKPNQGSIKDTLHKALPLLSLDEELIGLHNDTLVRLRKFCYASKQCIIIVSLGSSEWISKFFANTAKNSHPYGASLLNFSPSGRAGLTIPILPFPHPEEPGTIIIPLLLEGITSMRSPAERRKMGLILTAAMVLCNVILFESPKAQDSFSIQEMGELLSQSIKDLYSLEVHVPEFFSTMLSPEFQNLPVQIKYTTLDKLIADCIKIKKQMPALRDFLSGDEFVTLIPKITNSINSENFLSVVKHYFDQVVENQLQPVKILLLDQFRHECIILAISYSPDKEVDDLINEIEQIQNCYRARLKQSIEQITVRSEQNSDMVRDELDLFFKLWSPLACITIFKEKKVQYDLFMDLTTVSYQKEEEIRKGNEHLLKTQEKFNNLQKIRMENEVNYNKQLIQMKSQIGKEESALRLTYNEAIQKINQNSQELLKSCP